MGLMRRYVAFHGAEGEVSIENNVHTYHFPYFSFSFLCVPFFVSKAS